MRPTVTESLPDGISPVEGHLPLCPDGLAQARKGGLRHARGGVGAAHLASSEGSRAPLCSSTAAVSRLSQARVHKASGSRASAAVLGGVTLKGRRSIIVSLLRHAAVREAVSRTGMATGTALCGRASGLTTKGGRC